MGPSPRYPPGRPGGVARSGPGRPCAARRCARSRAVGSRRVRPGASTRTCSCSLRLQLQPPRASRRARPSRRPKSWGCSRGRGRPRWRRVLALVRPSAEGRRSPEGSRMLGTAIADHPTLGGGEVAGHTGESSFQRPIACHSWRLQAPSTTLAQRSDARKWTQLSGLSGTCHSRTAIEPAGTIP